MGSQWIATKDRTTGPEFLEARRTMLILTITNTVLDFLVLFMVSVIVFEVKRINKHGCDYRREEGFRSHNGKTNGR